jgi:hypothetical protein
MTTLEKIQNWYKSQCNEDWEHSFGVNITSLDNPGWLIEIDLKDTEVEGKEFTVIENLAHKTDWIHCSVENNKFKGAGGPDKLEEILLIFLKWVE